MAAILEALRGRLQQRQLNAIDTIAAGAKAAAQGERYDVAAIENALVETGQTMAAFEEAVERASHRAAWLADFEKLANASTKVKKLEASLATEQARFEAARTAYFEKAAALEEQLRKAQATREKGRQAQDRLLEPRGVPGTIGERYRQAVAEADAAEAGLGDAQRAVREQLEKIKSEQAWIQQLLGEQEQQLRPSLLRPSARDAQQEPPRLQDHRRALARAEKRKAEAEAELGKAEKRATLAHKAVDAMLAEVLQA